VPRLAARAVTATVAQNLHAQARVALAGPFWQIAQGGFQDLSLRTGAFTYQGYRLQALSLAWRNGRIDLSSLVGGQLRVLRAGRLTLAVTLDQASLRADLAKGLQGALPSGAAGAPPTVAIAPGGITLDGSVTFLGLPVRYRIDGDLVLQRGGQVLAFQTRDFNDSVLHLPALPVLRMSTLPRIEGLPLHIASVRLLRGALALTLAGP